MYYIGLDIGGTKCAVCIGEVKDGVLTLIDKEKFATGKGRDPYEVLAELYTHSVSVLEKHGMSFSGIAGIGISCGGPLDASRGVILSPPNLPGWDHIEIVKYYEEKTGVKTYLQNDANACAVAEWKFGAGRDPETGKCVDNMIFCTFGTGLGAGLAGEVGHLRLVPADADAKLPLGYGKRGSAEGFCSGGGIAQLGCFAVENALANGEEPRLWLEAEKNYDNITAKLIADLADAGDEMCLGIYQTCANRLGQTLSIIIHLLNPQKIVLGGIFMRSAHLLRETMEDVIAHETLGFASEVCQVVPAGLGETIGDYAALSVATGNF